MAVLLLAGALTGCGSKDPFPLASVQGTVTFQGKRLEIGRVVFVPAKGTPGPQAVGRIGSDGSFRMLVVAGDDNRGWKKSQRKVSYECLPPPSEP